MWISVIVAALVIIALKSYSYTLSVSVNVNSKSVCEFKSSGPLQTFHIRVSILQSLNVHTWNFKKHCLPGQLRSGGDVSYLIHSSINDLPMTHHKKIKSICIYFKYINTKKLHTHTYTHILQFDLASCLTRQGITFPNKKVYLSRCSRS